VNGKDLTRLVVVMGSLTLVVALVVFVDAVGLTPAHGDEGRLRVCTANIQNTPDMPDHQVREDVRTAARSCDLVLWQEIGERSDYRAVREALGRPWATTRRTAGGVPISWRTARLRGAGEPEALRVSDPTPRCPDGSPSYNPARWVTLAPLQLRDTGQRFTALSLHYPQRNGCRREHRADRWRQAWTTTREHLPAGPLVIGGDWNRREPEIPAMTRWHWTTPAPRALDHIAVARTGWRVTHKFTRRLNSDHSLRGTVLNTR